MIWENHIRFLHWNHRNSCKNHKILPGNVLLSMPPSASKHVDYISIITSSFHVLRPQFKTDYGCKSVEAKFYFVTCTHGNFVTRIPKWLNFIVQRTFYINQRGFYQPHCFSVYKIVYHWHWGAPNCGNKFPLCWHTHPISTSIVCVCSFVSGMKIPVNRVCVYLFLSNLKRYRIHYILAALMDALQSEWVKKGGEEKAHGKFYAQNDKLIVYCFWLKKWLLSCDAWLTTIILWNVHNNAIVSYFYSVFLRSFFLHVSAGAHHF